MGKLNSLTTITLLLFLTLVHVLARPTSMFHDANSLETHSKDHELQKVEIDENRCGGVEEDECMMRRTLQAHLDYIYTQNHKNP
ncbi:phytosulfokines 3 [Phtheirospermum japonicum]|uniref:Phytosulfokine n=1 Tax=Phtheirospermum japonicum TaxID=374723 RepID=A0A830CME4_9LAMI|nr:phytosulfokines 3 [Phtheirospermum japonicum]